MAGIKPTRAQAMADAVNASSIEANIKQQQSGKGYAIRECACCFCTENLLIDD